MTVAIALAFVFFYPMCICGCHFHAIALIPNAFPVVWGFYVLFSANGTGERVIGWVAFIIAVLCIWFGVETNLIYLL